MITMGFLTRFFQARDAPTNSTSGAAYSFFMGISAAGKNVNERSAMQMTAVYACVRILLRQSLDYRSICTDMRLTALKRKPSTIRSTTNIGV